MSAKLPARWSLGRLLLVCVACVAAWIGVAWACLYFGSTAAGWPGDAQVLMFRRDSVLTASLVGAALAAAGVVYQAVLRNPLAEPYLLGVSSGAGLASFLWGAQWGPAVLPLIAGLGQQAYAFGGAMAALIVVFGLAQRRGRLEPMVLLLVGVIVNAICGAIFLLLIHLHLRFDPVAASSGGAFRFLVGGINTSLTAWELWSAAVCIGVTWVIMFYLCGQLNVAGLEESEAQAMGVRIHRLRWVALTIASLAAAAAVGISGPIAFVGLICPHLGRMLVGSDHRRLLPVATALGAILLAVADTAARRISNVTWGPLPVGVLTGMLGGPFFIFLLWRSRLRGSWSA